MVQLAGAAEYTDCIFAEREDSSNKSTAYDTKQSAAEAPLMDLLGMPSDPLLTSLPGTLWPGVVAPDRVLFIVLIEQYCVLMLN